ncbi:MAG: hypothetical protein ACK51A_04790 [Sphingobacteriia bacterium]
MRAPGKNNKNLVCCLLLCLGGCFFPLNGHAQKSIADSSISFFTLSPYYQANWSAGTLADRFGFHSGLGAQVGYKHKLNFYFTLGAHALFGNVVYERGIIADLGYTYSWTDGDGSTQRTGGWIDGQFGAVERPSLFMRGYAIPLRVGYIFNQLRLGKQNPNCGLFVETGLQFIQHKILITTPTNADMPYLSSELKKGYDRLTNGLGTLASVGYQFYGNRRFINFFIALDAAFNVTQNRRSYNYDTGLQDNRSRSDVQYGARIGWTLPIYGTAPEKYYYY